MGIGGRDTLVYVTTVAATVHLIASSSGVSTESVALDRVIFVPSRGAIAHRGDNVVSTARGRRYLEKHV